VHDYSVLVDLVSLLFIIYTYVQASRKKFARGEGAIWIFVWLLVGIFASFPSLFSSITVLLGVALPINLIYGVFLLFLLFMIYRLEERVNELQRVILVAVQEKSIRERKEEPEEARE